MHNKLLYATFGYNKTKKYFFLYTYGFIIKISEILDIFLKIFLSQLYYWYFIIFKEK